MAKSNVQVGQLQAWDEYEGKPFKEALPAIYSHAGNIAQDTCAWYWKSIRTKKISSLWVRSASLTLGVIGTVLPLLAGMIASPEIRLYYTQCGVIMLAIAGLLQLADKVFGWSSGWMRYITTVTAMENLTRQFELDWASFLVDKGSSLGDSDTKTLFEIARKFEADIHKMRSDETDKWVAEFNSGLALLGDMIKTQREIGEKNVEAARAAVQSGEKARQNGAIELSLVHKAAPVAVSIALDDETAQEFIGLSWTRTEAKPGQHTLTLTTPGPAPQIIQKIIEVQSGGVARMEVKLP